MLAAEHVLRHLRGTYNKYIQYSRDVPRTLRNVLWGAVDSDWAGDTDTPIAHWICPHVEWGSYFLEISGTASSRFCVLVYIRSRVCGG